MCDDDWELKWKALLGPSVALLHVSSFESTNFTVMLLDWAQSHSTVSRRLIGSVTADALRRCLLSFAGLDCIVGDRKAVVVEKSLSHYDTVLVWKLDRFGGHTLQGRHILSTNLTSGLAACDTACHDRSVAYRPEATQLRDETPKY